MASNKTKKTAQVVTFAVFFTIIDRYLKMFALSQLADKSLPVLSDLFKFNLAKNFGIAFSLPLSGIFLNILIIILIIGLFVEILRFYNTKRLPEAYTLIFVVFGAFSNLFDRIIYGYVIDYLDLKYFTVFNIADTMIVGGIAIFILLNFQNKNKQKKDK